MALDLDHIFRYHPPQGDDPEKYEHIRSKARQFAEAIVLYVPEGADQSDAIRKVREAVMTANAGIALQGRLREQSKPSAPSDPPAPPEDTP